MVTQDSKAIFVGFLRVKTVKGHQYVYWCQRVRSRKKSGGDGKVKCHDFLIGNHLTQEKYLAFYFYREEVPLREYAAAVVDYICQTQLVTVLGMKHNLADVSTRHIDWGSRPPKVYLRSANKLIDFRRKHWQELKQVLQINLDVLCDLARQAQENIELASHCLTKYEEWTNEGQAQRAQLQDYRKNPGKTWTSWESVQNSDTGVWEQKEFTYQWKENADIVIDEEITRSDKIASDAWSGYQETLDKIIGYAPRQRQEEFKSHVSKQVEKLAKDTRWVERYKMQLESTS